MNPLRPLVPLAIFLGAAGSSISFGAAAIPNNAAANLVLGQALFTTSTAANPVSFGSLNNPSGVAVDPGTGKVFVADAGSNRILRYPSASGLANGQPAELVIGQANFSDSAPNQGGAASQSSLNLPSDVFVDSAGNLWVADTQNSRVLLFKDAARLSHMPVIADRVYGQPDFVTVTPHTFPSSPTQTSLSYPTGLCVDPAGVLWVADNGSHRVLGFKDAVWRQNGATADRVLGQSSFTTTSDGATQTGLLAPQGVSADATHVWVADFAGNRVVRYPNFPTVDGALADLVLGQASYATTTSATTADGLNAPASVFVNGTSVWVCDSRNNRLLRYDDAANLASGAGATGLLGQLGFTAGSSGVTSRRISPEFAHLWVTPAGDLWLADKLNNRVLRFPAASPTPAPAVPPTVTVNGPRRIKVTKPLVVLTGTAASASGILRVSYAIGSGSYVKAKGTTTWRARIKLLSGKNYVTVNSVDKNGLASAPTVITVRRLH